MQAQNISDNKTVGTNNRTGDVRNETAPATKSLNLSLIMVTHNSAETITKTILSAEGLVDEIIIIDGESTDNTVDVVKSFGPKVRVLHEKNHPNFVLNKQKALEKATGEWILELDDDEVITPELATEIKKALTSTSESNQSDDILGYWIPRLNHFINSPLRKGGQYPDYTIRLYKRKHARFPGKSIHDQVEINGTPTTKAHLTLTNSSGKTILGVFENHIRHYPYRNISVFFRKWSQYAMWEGDTSFKIGVRPSFIAFLQYFIIKPKIWFLMTYFRHKGFQDGFAGFAFSLLSGLRYWVEYLRIVELSRS